MGTYTWNIVIVANTFWQKPISDFPSKNRRTFSLVFWNTFHDAWSSHPRFGSADGTRLNRARFIVPEKKCNFCIFPQMGNGYFCYINQIASSQPDGRYRQTLTDGCWQASNKRATKIAIPSKNFGHTSIGNLKNSWNITWPSSWMGQFNDFLSCWVRQRTSIDVNSSELIYTTMSWNKKKKVRFLYWKKNRYTGGPYFIVINPSLEKAL